MKYEVYTKLINDIPNISFDLINNISIQNTKLIDEIINKFTNRISYVLTFNTIAYCNIKNIMIDEEIYKYFNDTDFYKIILIHEIGHYISILNYGIMPYDTVEEVFKEELIAEMVLNYFIKNEKWYEDYFKYVIYKLNRKTLFCVKLTENEFNGCLLNAKKRLKMILEY